MATNYKPLSEEELKAMKRAAATAKFLSIPADVVGKGVNALWEFPGVMMTGKGWNQRQSDRLTREAGAQGVGGTPQTRDHNWFDGGNNYASQPGTGQFIRLPEDMQTTTAEDRGNLATAKAAQNTDIANQKSIGATNARASLMKAASRQSSSKGSVGKDLARIQEIRKEQIPTDTKQETQRVETKGSQTPYQSYTDIPFDKGIGVDTGIDYNKQPNWYKGQNLYQQSSTPNEQASSSSFAANMEQAAGGAMMSIAKVLLSEAMKSNKGAEPNVNESKGADKSVDTRFYVPTVDELQNAWYA